METHLQESGGLRRTAPIQSPVPSSGARLTILQRVLVACFLAVLAFGYLAHLVPVPGPASGHRPVQGAAGP